MVGPSEFLGLSRRERQIMDVLYRVGSATAAEICRALPDPPTTTTVRGLLRILGEKGQVRHELDGPRYLYRPAKSRDAAAEEILPHVVRTFFGGSASRAMAALLGPRAQTLDADEIEELGRLVEEARRRNK